MRKEYESPMCKVVTVEKKDILTLSDTTVYKSFRENAIDANGDFDNGYNGGYIGWGSAKW